VKCERPRLLHVFPSGANSRQHSTSLNYRLPHTRSALFGWC